MVLPAELAGLSEAEVFERIECIKGELGDDLIILGHHYQRDEVLRFADISGDSLELSRAAAKNERARYIVFCGVDFMAETAAILCSPGQTVLIPARNAVCPMAGMADLAEVQAAWDIMMELWDGDALPITYQNSTAEVKAFCGRNGGAVCTSSNAQALFRWALEERGHLVFFPDEHLGRNTALASGLSMDDIVVWDPKSPPEDRSRLREATVVVWKGFCNVHTHFRPEHVWEIREQHEDIVVVVHPECPFEVVREADLNGSTSFIIRTVEEGPAGSKFGVGTEINLVNRLANANPDKMVLPLARSLCGAMYRVNPQNLLHVLQGLTEGELINAVELPDDTTRWANLALEKMLEVK
jgi:quinolinate synthase